MALVHIVGQVRQRLEGLAQCSEELKGKARRGLRSQSISFHSSGAGAIANHSRASTGLRDRGAPCPTRAGQLPESISSFVRLPQHSPAVPLTCSSSACPSSLLPHLSRPPSALTWTTAMVDTAPSQIRAQRFPTQDPPKTFLPAWDKSKLFPTAHSPCLSGTLAQLSSLTADPPPRSPGQAPSAPCVATFAPALLSA